ncbi:winged helix-turn-helix domain-containing protein [Haloglomus litoreum]|uniref:winged helix-turn-helix domain-containing protein n=1 Tax=Haloglomus litoreum TaxID=3034026 RepID=UPI0023E8E198|nr:winged helix-turn-helix domain-containing protein [Haloglomus sp. DT116]
MEESLWYLLAGTRGSENRARIVRTLDEQPRNANRLSEALGLDYNTVRHHLDTLCEHDVVVQGSEGYGAVYRLTDEFEAHRDTYERVLATVPYAEPVPEAGDAGGEAE